MYLLSSGAAAMAMARMSARPASTTAMLGRRASPSATARLWLCRPLRRQFAAEAAASAEPEPEPAGVSDLKQRKGLPAELLGDAKVGKYYLKGISRLSVARREFVCVAAVASSVSDAALELLMRDDRVARNVTEIDAAMRAAMAAVTDRSRKVNGSLVSLQELGYDWVSMDDGWQVMIL